MTEQRYSKPLKFSYLMLKFISIPLYFERLGSQQNIKDSFLEMRLKEIYTQELTDFVHSLLPDIDKGILDEEKAKHLQEMRLSLLKEMDDIGPILLNQALVMCCTILESFLDDCLRVIMPLPIVFMETERDLARLTTLLDSGGTGEEYDEDLFGGLLSYQCW